MSYFQLIMSDLYFTLRQYMRNYEALWMMSVQPILTYEDFYNIIESGEAELVDYVHQRNPTLDINFNSVIKSGSINMLHYYLGKHCLLPDISQIGETGYIYMLTPLLEYIKSDHGPSAVKERLMHGYYCCIMTPNNLTKSLRLTELFLLEGIITHWEHALLATPLEITKLLKKHLGVWDAGYISCYNSVEEINRYFFLDADGLNATPRPGIIDLILKTNMSESFKAELTEKFKAPNLRTQIE